MPDLEWDTFKIWNETGRGRDTHIELNGVDISHALYHVFIDADVMGLIDVELSPGVLEPEPDDRPARIRFYPGVRELLIKHGWSPPCDERSVSLSQPS